jgi:hypothetical protein
MNDRARETMEPQEKKVPVVDGPQLEELCKYESG